MNGEGPPFYGKYRGVVTDNKDPKGIGRIKATVQDVLGREECGWATPCVPFAGKDVGLYLIPPKDAFVWIEFEHGDPDSPVWSGCFWAEGETPVEAASKTDMPNKKVLRTAVGTIAIDESPGKSSITIESNRDPKMKIVMSSDGIEINNGKNATAKLKDNKVSINGNALEIE